MTKKEKPDPYHSRKMTVEVRHATRPDGQVGILLQFEDGWAIINPDGARHVATMLVEAADEVEGIYPCPHCGDNLINDGGVHFNWNRTPHTCLVGEDTMGGMG